METNFVGTPCSLVCQLAAWDSAVIKTETEDGSWCGSSKTDSIHPSGYTAYRAEKLVFRLKVTLQNHWTELVIFSNLYSAGALVAISARAKTNFTKLAVTLLYLQDSSGSEPQNRSSHILSNSLLSKHSTLTKASFSGAQIKITLEVFLLKHPRNLH